MAVVNAGYDIVLLGISQILPTEQSDPAQVAGLLTEVTITQVWTDPIIVDDATYAVMDGHHRLAVARELGLKVVPAIMLSYDDPRVRLESWRAGESYSAEEIRARALSGQLLPLKSTRHIIEPWPPQTRIALAHLGMESERGAFVDPALPPNSRVASLIPFYHRLGAHAEIRTEASRRVGTESAETQAPHPMLRHTLQSDPAMAALLPAAAARIALGTADDAPFRVATSGVVLLPPMLLDDPAVLAAAARWALETAYLVGVERRSPQALGRALAMSLVHGAALLRALDASQSRTLLEHVPGPVAAFMRAPATCGVPAEALRWQASLVDGIARWIAPDHEFAAGELSQCVEQILVAGGDSRLRLDDVSGLNRYGTVPRPRPEAVQFSSSTASSVSDYGFMLCDMLRRDLLAAGLREQRSEQALRSDTVDALGAELLSLLSLSSNEADIAFAPSGTDTELLAVMLALAHEERALTNIVIAPDETGRGVAIAAAGCYFDDVAATGAAVSKGAAAWPWADIEVVTSRLRADDGQPRPVADIDRELADLVRDATARGRRVLLHVLASSKTGLSAPTLEAVGRIERDAGDAIDVVVDVCQMRNPMNEVGGWVRRGWLVQASGSKFLTGPPFSGVLIVPRSYRLRAARVTRLLADAPGVGHADDWNRWWRDALAPGGDAPSFGPLFRVLPAMAEAVLLAALPAELCRYAFDRFQQAIRNRLECSRCLLPIETWEPDDDSNETAPDLTAKSIVSFTINTSDAGGRMRALDAAECQRLFELLNLDISDLLPSASPSERVKAALQAHIGQPVTLPGPDGDMTVLRLVVGARFFTIVGHAGPGAIEASLESEIADALRALDKVELLAERWQEIAALDTRLAVAG